MSIVTRMADVARSPGDPEVLTKGRSSLGPSDRLARGLGWFSIGLGIAEILAPRAITRTLGMGGKTQRAMVRACGLREIAAGVLSLSVDRKLGIASRVVGDAADIATLVAARRRGNPNGTAVDLALAAVISITILDIICYQGLRARHNRPSSQWRDYSNRSGLPKGVESSRGLARQDFEMPPDMRAGFA